LDEYLKQILKTKRIGFAVFNENLQLLGHNFRFTAYRMPADLTPQPSLWQLFSLLTGSEETIQAIITGRKSEYTIEKVNSLDPAGRITYHNLTFYSLPSHVNKSERLLCLIDDVTTQAALEQQIRQKNYEIQLVKAQLLSKDQFLASGLLGDSEPIRMVREFVHKVSNHNTTILLQGESGTGKSLVARLIHNAAATTDKSPFVEINCAAIPETLLESELFGYEKGAFTNALSSKQGLLEAADGGTLFLDEIGELPSSMQVKLLTFLETMRFRRLGGIEEKRVQLRLVAATNKNLKEAISQNEFRQDLFYRINVAALSLPPLRDLGPDVIILAEHFMRVLAIDLKKEMEGFSPAAKQKLGNYLWPGNVRELRNVIERAIIFATGDIIDASDLLIMDDFADLGNGLTKNIRLPEEGLSLEEVERDLLNQSLKQSHGNQSQAARLLGLSLDTFRYRIHKYGLTPENYR